MTPSDISMNFMGSDSHNSSPEDREWQTKGKRGLPMLQRKGKGKYGEGSHSSIGIGGSAKGKSTKGQYGMFPGKKGMPALTNQNENHWDLNQSLTVQAADWHPSVDDLKNYVLNFQENAELLDGQLWVTGTKFSQIARLLWPQITELQLQKIWSLVGDGEEVNRLSVKEFCICWHFLRWAACYVGNRRQFTIEILDCVEIRARLSTIAWPWHIGMATAGQEVARGTTDSKSTAATTSAHSSILQLVSKPAALGTIPEARIEVMPTSTSSSSSSSGSNILRSGLGCGTLPTSPALGLGGGDYQECLTPGDISADGSPAKRTRVDRRTVTVHNTQQRQQSVTHNTFVSNAGEDAAARAGIEYVNQDLADSKQKIEVFGSSIKSEQAKQQSGLEAAKQGLEHLARDAASGFVARDEKIGELGNTQNKILHHLEAQSTLLEALQKQSSNQGLVAVQTASQVMRDLVLRDEKSEDDARKDLMLMAEAFGIQGSGAFIQFYAQLNFTKPKINARSGIPKPTDATPPGGTTEEWSFEENRFVRISTPDGTPDAGAVGGGKSKKPSRDFFRGGGGGDDPDGSDDETYCQEVGDACPECKMLGGHLYNCSFHPGLVLQRECVSCGSWRTKQHTSTCVEKLSGRTNPGVEVCQWCTPKDGEHTVTRMGKPCPPWSGEDAERRLCVSAM